MTLATLTLREMMPALAAGRVLLDAVYLELRYRPCLDADWRPGAPIPVPLIVGDVR